MSIRTSRSEGDQAVAGRAAAAGDASVGQTFGVGRRPDSLRRWLLAALGVVCVGLAAVGVVVPGLPTTVFLIAATWLFTRSCPWLEEKLVRHRFFAPFQAYLEPGARMPRRARVIALAAMWTAITVSVVVLMRGEPGGVPRWLVPALVAAAGVVGTVVILRVRRGEVRGLAGQDGRGAERTLTCER